MSVRDGSIHKKSNKLQCMYVRTYVCGCEFKLYKKYSGFIVRLHVTMVYRSSFHLRLVRSNVMHLGLRIFEIYHNKTQIKIILIYDLNHFHFSDVYPFQHPIFWWFINWIVIFILGFDISGYVHFIFEILSLRLSLKLFDMCPLPV